MAVVRELFVIWLVLLLRLRWLQPSSIVSVCPSHLCGPTNVKLYVAPTQRGLLLPVITRRESRQMARYRKCVGSRFFQLQRTQYRLSILTICLLLSGDVEPNPGPSFKFPCARCEKPVKSNQKGLQCDACDRWFHCACEQVPSETYLALGNCEESWFCAQCCLPPLSDSFFGSPSASHHNDRPSCGPNDDLDLDSQSPWVSSPGVTVSATGETTKSKMLRIVHLNARSLISHLDEIALLVASQRPDILAVSETWLDSEISDGEVSLPGYSVTRLDRNRHGGGVAVFCANYLNCSILAQDTGISASGLESLWVAVESRLFPSPLAVGCFYRPPGSPCQSVHDVCSRIETMLLARKYVVACGDLNIDMSDLAKPNSKLFCDFLESHSLTQPISQPTRISESSSSLIDLFLVTPDVSISKSMVLDCAISDHLPILLDLALPVFKPAPRSIKRRSFKHFSEADFVNDLWTVPWCIVDLFDDVDDKVSVFNTLFQEVLEVHAPIKSVRVKKNPAPWISKSIRDEMDKRNRLLKLHRRNPSSLLWAQFKAQRNRVVSLQRQAKKDYFYRLISSKTHPSTLWKTLKLACRSDQMDSSTSGNTDHKTFANALNAHFVSVSSGILSPDVTLATSTNATPDSVLSLSPTTPSWCEETLSSFKPRCASGLDKIPSSTVIAAKSVICFPLCSILNSSISSSVFPRPWKSASIKPLHKGGDRATPANYRPISLLPVCSKLLERCVNEQLTSHLHLNNLVYLLQSGFRPQHSTQTLLLHCTDSWYKALDRKQFVGVIFLDISKAFDTVNHDLLLAKLSHLGLSPSTVTWFRSYLTDRSQVTRVGDCSSSLGFPSSGVPQGSVLGPTLFSAFINDLPEVLPPDSTVLFADDTSIYIISDNLPSLNSSLQLCLNLANLWMMKNGLRLNTLKSKCMLIHSSRRKVEGKLELCVDGLPIEQVRVFKFLGVLLNDTLTWNDHIGHICTKVSRSLNLLRRLSWFLPKSLLLLYFKSYVLPTFDYCDVVWSNCTNEDAKRLETLFNFGCRLVLHKPRFYSASSARQELHFTTLSARRKFHMCQTMYKCMNSLSPPYLTRLFRTPSTHHNTRASSTKQLNLPMTNSTFGQKAFSFTGALVWRSLPDNVRLCKDYSLFCKLCSE